MSVSIEFDGNVGADPETRTFQNGNTLTEFSVACSQGYFDKQHQWVDQGVTWFRVHPFGKQAENQLPYIRKGCKVLINGTLETREYQDKQGQNRVSLNVTARHIGIVHVPDKSSGSNSQFGGGNPWGGAQPAQRQAVASAAPTTAAPVADPWGAPQQSGFNGDGFGGGDDGEPAF